MPEFINGAKIKIVKDYDSLSQTAANWVIDLLSQRPGASLLVPTGTTPEGMYSLLSEQSADTFQGVKFYNLDEYCVADQDSYRFLDHNDDRSYRYYMSCKILNAIPTIQSFFPEIDNIGTPGTYDKFIRANGGLDLAINSIGEDGHIFGFNIPGSEFDSVTRLIPLNEETRQVNARLTGGDIPTHAISSGIQT